MKDSKENKRQDQEPALPEPAVPRIRKSAELSPALYEKPFLKKRDEAREGDLWCD